MANARFSRRRERSEPRSAGTGGVTGSSADLGYGQSATDLSGKNVGNLGVPRHRFDRSRRRVGPQRVRSPFAFQVASVLSKMAKQVAPLHPTMTFSRLADAGTPRRPSFRRSSRMSAIALDKLFSAAAFVRPCPLAPGISGQYAMCQRPERSTTAVNSFRMSPPLRSYPTPAAVLASGALKEDRARRCVNGCLTDSKKRFESHP